MSDEKGTLNVFDLAILWQMLFPPEESYFSCPKCDREILETTPIELIDKKPHNFQCPYCYYVFYVEEVKTPASQKSAKFPKRKKKIPKT